MWRGELQGCGNSEGAGINGGGGGGGRRTDGHAARLMLAEDRRKEEGIRAGQLEGGGAQVTVKVEGGCPACRHQLLPTC